MSRTPNETRTALDLLSRGSTRGMAVKQLIAQGLTEHLAIESVETAARSYNRRPKMVSAIVAVAGALLTVVGGGGLYYCIVNQRRTVELPITLLVIGVMVMMYGAYGTVRNRI